MTIPPGQMSQDVTKAGQGQAFPPVFPEEKQSDLEMTVSMVGNDGFEMISGEGVERWVFYKWK